MTPLFLLLFANGPMSLCDLMPRLQEFKNKMISVRGELTLTKEFTDLGLHTCSQSQVFVTNGYRWPIGVHLAWPGYYGLRNFEGKTVSIDFEKDQKNFDDMLALY